MGRPKGSKDTYKRPTLLGKGYDEGLRLAIRAASKHVRARGRFRNSQAKLWLANHLGIRVQSLNHWKRVPRDRVLMVHRLTGVPLEKLAPEIFK